MIKCEVTREFTLGKFDELKNIKRKNPERNEKGRLYLDDTFECTEEMADYLTGNNANEDIVVRIIEVVPEKKEKKIGETKVIKTASKLKKTTKIDKK